MTVAKRKGRPRKPDQGPSTVVLGAMRVRPEVYEEIRQDAEKYGRSIAAQAERRVAHREPEIRGEIGRIVDLAIEAIEKRTGKTWRDDAAVRIECLSASETILKLLLGDRVENPSLVELLAGGPDLTDAERLERRRLCLDGFKGALATIDSLQAEQR